MRDKFVVCATSLGLRMGTLAGRFGAMPRTHKVHRVCPPGREPYYKIIIGGRQHHLGTNESRAYRRAAELLRDQPAPTAPLSVAGLIEAWKHAQPASRNDDFTKSWKLFAGAVPLFDVEAQALQMFAAHLYRRELSAWTVIKYVRHAQRVCRWAVARGWIEVMPDPPKLRKPVAIPRDVGAEQLATTFESLPTRAGRLLRFVLETGCRPGEARLLQWTQVDLSRCVCVLAAHKTAAHGSARTIHLTPAAVALVKEAEGPDSDYVFVSGLGKPYTKSGLQSILKRHGISSTYSLRHTRAQQMLDSGVPLEVVAAWLGHSGMRTVQTYAQVRNRRLTALAADLTPALPVQARGEKPGSGAASRGRRRRPASSKSNPRKRATGTAG